MKTLKFTATFGVVAGYGHNNDNEANAASLVAKTWQKAAAEMFAAKGIYVSAVVNESKTVYHESWGCPKGGEKTATVSGEANPAFVQDTTKWKQAVIEVCSLVKKELKQSTVAVSFSEVDDFIYLTND